MIERMQQLLNSFQLPKKLVEIMELIWNLPDDRYVAIEDVRKIVGFSTAEWKCLLQGLSKTHNGWLQFVYGELTIDFKKIIDLNELHMKLELRTHKNVTKTAKYIYDLAEFTRISLKKEPPYACKKRS